jgi:hypothetical protein
MSPFSASEFRHRESSFCRRIDAQRAHRKQEPLHRRSYMVRFRIALRDALDLL